MRKTIEHYIRKIIISWDIGVIALLSLFLVTFIKGTIRILLYPYHHDVTYLLYVTQQILRGYTPYVDIKDLNTLFIYVFNMPAILFSKLSGIFVLDALNIWVFIVIAFVIVLSFYALRRVFTTRATLFFMCVFSGLFMLDVYHVAQREYLVILFTLPYLLGKVSEMYNPGQSKKLKIIYGILMGFGVLLKPHFVVIPIVAELFTLIKKRSIKATFRVDTVSAICVGIVFIVILKVLMPAYFELSNLALSNYIGFGVGYNDPFWMVVNTPYARWLLIGTVLLFLYKKAGAMRDLLTLFTFVGFASWFGAVSQGNIWDYHFFPMYFCVSMIWAIHLYTIGAWFVRRPWWNEMFVVVVGSMVMSLAFYIVISVPLFDYTKVDFVKHVDSVVREHITNKDIGVFSTEIFPLFPSAIHANANITLPYYHFWPLPGFYTPKDIITIPFPYHSLTEMSDFERDFHQSIVDSLIQNPPEVLIIEIDVGKHGLGNTSFDYLEYFGLDERFGPLMEEYELLREDTGFAYYSRL